MFAILKEKAFFKVFIFLIVFVISYFFFFSQTKFFTIPRLKFADLFSVLSYRTQPLPLNLDKIKVIIVDDASYRVLKKSWPWPRTKFATLLDKLRAHPPKVIFMDFVFVGESIVPEYDTIFAEAIAKSGNVILASFLDPRGRYTLPFDLLTKKALAYGLVNKPRNPDLSVRSSRLFIVPYWDTKPFDYSSEIKLFCKYLGASLKDISYDGRHVVIKSGNTIKALIPVEKNGTIPMHFRIKLNDLDPVPFWKVYNGEVPPETFKDKIVLVGATAEIFHDVYHSPIGLMPGVAIQTNAILMLLNSDFINYIPKSAELFLLLGLGLATFFFVYFFPPSFALLFSFIETVAVLGIGFAMFLRNIRFDYFSAVFVIVVTYLGISIYKYLSLWIENLNLRTLAITDGLTGLYIHRYFILRMQNEFERAARYNLYFSFVIMDIDHFKNVNDTYGHQQGNVVLKHMSQILQAQSRKTDFVARYGGEEFCAILTHTNLQGAVNYAERVRRAVEAYEFPYKPGKPLKLTVSSGVVSYPQYKTEKMEGLIEAADKVLYEAKHGGRNRVCAAGVSQGPNAEDSQK
ncbi:MAG: diguanylate cyclase [Candidatus Omnitrophota bacterium]|nr:MAG: diguanylate cyclase [Candidatus Omnitrophota bacterium]